MENKLLRFDAFQSYKSYQQIKEGLELYDAINEAFQSSILREFNTQESGGRWGPNLAKDIFKTYKIKLDEVTNEDFVKIDPEQYFDQGYKKDPNVIGFFVDDNPEFLKALDARQYKARKGTKFGVITTILRGNKCMYFGFTDNSGWGRRKKSGSDRYGVLADEYQTGNIYNFTGRGVKASLTVKNIKEVSTACYLLNMETLREKYGADVRQAERAAAKKGAAAFLTNDQVKQENKRRWDSALQAGLTPEGIFADVKKTLDKYMTWFNKQINDMKLDGKEILKLDQVQWQGWNSDIGRPISDMLRFLDEFTRDYNYAIKDLKHCAELGAKLEKEEDDRKKARLQGEIEYYEGSWDRFIKKAASKRDEVLKAKASVDKIVG